MWFNSSHKYCSRFCTSHANGKCQRPACTFINCAHHHNRTLNVTFIVDNKEPCTFTTLHTAIYRTALHVKRVKRVQNRIDRHSVPFSLALYLFLAVASSVILHCHSTANTQQQSIEIICRFSRVYVTYRTMAFPSTHRALCVNFLLTHNSPSHSVHRVTRNVAIVVLILCV